MARSWAKIVCREGSVLNVRLTTRTASARALVADMSVVFLPFRPEE